MRNIPRTFSQFPRDIGRPRRRRGPRQPRDPDTITLFLFHSFDVRVRALLSRHDATLSASHHDVLPPTPMDAELSLCRPRSAPRGTPPVYEDINAIIGVLNPLWKDTATARSLLRRLPPTRLAERQHYASPSRRCAPSRASRHRRRSSSSPQPHAPVRWHSFEGPDGRDPLRSAPSRGPDA